MSKNLLSKMVLVKNNEFTEEDEPRFTDGKPEEEEKASEEEEEEEEDTVKYKEGDGTPEEVEPEGLPAQNIIKVLHEHNGWDLDEEAINKYDNSEDGLMQFVADIVKANTPEPQYASEEVKAFNEYVNNGGDPSKFLDTYYSNGNFNYEEANVEEEDTAKKVYEDYLRATTSFSDKKIAKEIQTKLDLDELSEEAKEAQEYMIEYDKKTKESLKVQLERDKEAQYQQNQNYLASQKKAIMDAKEIAGFEITDKLANELFEFGFNRGRDGRTGYERMKEEDPKLDLKLLMLAMKGVDKAKIAKEAQSEASKELRKNLSRFNDGTAKSTTNTAPADGKGKGDGKNFKKWLI